MGRAYRSPPTVVVRAAHNLGPDRLVFNNVEFPMVRSWFQKCVQALKSSCGKSHKSRRRPRAGYKPWAEAFEDRTMPSAAGMLDPTFGVGGKVSTDVAPNPDPSFDSVSAMTLQTDGKIILAG